MKRDVCIPVSTAQALAESLGLRQVIIVAWDGHDAHVVTYGGSDEDSANAANGGNMVKKALCWPAALNSESPKVQALKDRIANLEAQLSRLNRIPAPADWPSADEQCRPSLPVERYVHVIEGTEYERGWGQRPDGYVAFLSEEAAKAYINEYDKDFNNLARTPDEYTKYEYVGATRCSNGFFNVVTTKGRHFFDKLSEMLE